MTRRYHGRAIGGMMTLQKAMRVRSELKKEIIILDELIREYPYQISFRDNEPGAEEIATKRSEKAAALDGMTYEEVIKRLFAITDVILDLNTAIEKANRDGHTLLFKEAAIKSKISLLDTQIIRERKIIQKVESLEYDYDQMDEKGNYKKVKVINYNYPLLTNETFGMSLVDYKKKLQKELEEVRDQLSAFNASRKIDYELPEGF